MATFYDKNTLQAAGIDVQAVVAAIDTRREDWTDEEKAAAKDAMETILDRGGNVNMAASNREIGAAVNAVGNRSEHGVKRKVGQIAGEIAAEYCAEKRQLTQLGVAKDMVNTQLRHENTQLRQENTQLRTDLGEARLTIRALVKNSNLMADEFEARLIAMGNSGGDGGANA